ncbi:hypothetical protein [Schlesneria paludicola]|uniref:hypothetical protein n=1 Tax=Schlesneria paludicola TaxID=360056 RepID=UPI00029B0F5E|nr:hypothetical protein [Schlesneria paludicola]
MSFFANLIEDTSGYDVTSEGRLVKTYKRKYRCSNPGGYLNLDEVIVELNILPGNAHPEFPNALVRKISNERMFHQDPYYDWEVGVEYSTETPKFAEDPTERPVKRRVFTTETQRSIFQDRNGKLILDAAGCPFDGGVQVNHHQPTIVWQRNESNDTFNLAQFLALSGCINSDPFAGCDPETLLLVATSDETFESNYHYWASTYTIIYNELGWQPQPVNAGLWQRDGTNLVRITMDGEPVQDPQPLYAASSGTPGKVIPLSARPAACNFIKVDHASAIAFSSLSLPL